jgi:hypothetical protein
MNERQGKQKHGTREDRDTVDVRVKQAIQEQPDRDMGGNGGGCSGIQYE